MAKKKEVGPTKVESITGQPVTEVLPIGHPDTVGSLPATITPAEQEEIFLSKSAIDLFKQCSQKYQWHYIDKLKGIQSLQERQAAVFGQVVHEALEKYFESGKKLNLKDLYHEAFTKAEVVDQSLFELGEMMITDYANSYDNGYEIIGIEKEFKLYLPNGVPIKGVIDRIDKLSDEEIEIIDYKTGRSWPLTAEQLKTDLQLGMYHLAAKIMFPWAKKIKLTLSYLHFGQISTYRSDEELDVLLHYLLAMHTKIMQLYAKQIPVHTNLTPLCHYCEFKAKCDTFKDAISMNATTEQLEDKLATLVPSKTGMVVDMEVLDKFREAVKNKISVLKKVEEGIDEIIKSEASAQGGQSVQIGQTTFQVANTKRTTYSAKQVVPILLEKGIDLDKCLTVNKKETDLALKDDKATLKAINDGANVSWSDSFLRKGK